MKLVRYGNSCCSFLEIGNFLDVEKNSVFLFHYGTLAGAYHKGVWYKNNLIVRKGQVRAFNRFVGYRAKKDEIVLSDGLLLQKLAQEALNEYDANWKEEYQMLMGEK